MNAARALNVGDGMQPGTQVGPLAKPRQLAKMEELVADAVARGARVLAGGKRIEGDGFFFEPTVLADVPMDARVMHEEPFGPIAVLMPIDTLVDGLAEANRLPYGLSAYAFTSNARTAIDEADGLKAGMIGINQYRIVSTELPFGGMKESGHGAEGGTEGIGFFFTNKFISQIRNGGDHVPRKFQQPAGSRARVHTEARAFVDDTLYPKIWNDPALALRDRSLITVAALIAGGHLEELRSHLRRALANGVTRDELAAAITRLAFYAGLQAAIFSRRSSHAQRNKGSASMKAITFNDFGEADVLQLTEAPSPEVRPTNLLVRVHTAGVNRADLTHRRGVMAGPTSATRQSWVLKSRTKSSRPGATPTDSREATA